jgi:hypothetical protein
LAKQLISVNEQTGGTVPPSNEWLIVRINETTDLKSGFKFATWKSNLSKWIDESGNDITNNVTEASFYSKEDLEKINLLREKGDLEKSLKKKNLEKKPATYLKDLKLGDKIYNPKVSRMIILFL